MSVSKYDIYRKLTIILQHEMIIMKKYKNTIQKFLDVCALYANVFNEICHKCGKNLKSFNTKFNLLPPIVRTFQFGEQHFVHVNCYPNE